MSDSPPSSPLLNRYLPAISLALAAFGVPTIVIVSFTHFITTYPWLALGLGALYEVGIVLVGIVGQVWQKLQLRWVDRITDWADSRIQEWMSHYKRRYYRYLLFQHRDFDVKGLSTQGIYTLELSRVFVDLSIDPRPIHEASSNPLQVPQELREGNHSIWEYLASEPLTNQHLVILGPPGSGKTTLLKHITICLVTHHKPGHNIVHPKLPHKVPIVLFLRDHINKLKEKTDYSLVNALDDHLKKWEQSVPPPGWMNRQLSKGRCLVMLDGLDEVADSQARQEVVNWVQRQMVAYPMNRFIITSRPFGYRSYPLSGVTLLEVRPFTPQQVEQFIHNWYLANEIMSKQQEDLGVRMKAKVGAKDLLQRLHATPTLYALAVNPLLLTMITTVHRYRGSLPGKRGALYAEICEVFLGKRQEAREQILELSPMQMQLVLRPLAYYLMLRGERDITLDEAKSVIIEPLEYVSAHLSPEAFLRSVEQISGLMLERESGIYSFAHLTFQEYLAAAHIHAEALEQTLIGQVGVSWWHETIRLYCAQADATGIIVACLAGDRPSVPTLTLAIECQQEALKIQPTVSAQLDALLNQGIEDSDPERQHIVAEALLMRRVRHLIPLNEEASVDTSLITCAEYQIFLDDQHRLLRFYQPDHWADTHFPRSEGHTPVLGVRSSDAQAFCEWLTKWEQGPWKYRLPKVGELIQKERGDRHEGFVEGTGYWLDEAEGFCWARPLPLIREIMLQESIRTTLARSLTLTHFRARNHDRALVRFFNLEADLTPKLDLDHALNRALALDCILAIDLNRILDLALDFNRVLESALAIDHNLSRVLDRTLDRGFTDNIIHILDRTPNTNHDGEIEQILTRVLTLAYSFTRYQEVQALVPRTKRKRHFSHRRDIKQAEKEVQHLIDLCLDIYLYLLILKERREGKLPAIEGILLTREQK